MLIFNIHVIDYVELTAVFADQIPGSKKHPLLPKRKIKMERILLENKAFNSINPLERIKTLIGGVVECRSSRQ
jgi:hypothetical protein